MSEPALVALSRHLAESWDPGDGPASAGALCALYRLLVDEGWRAPPGAAVVLHYDDLARSALLERIAAGGR